MSAIREVAVGLVQRFALRATGGDLLRQAVTRDELYKNRSSRKTDSQY